MRICKVVARYAPSMSLAEKSWSGAASRRVMAPAPAPIPAVAGCCSCGFLRQPAMQCLWVGGCPLGQPHYGSS